MDVYKNRSGDSGVMAFRIHDNSITVKFVEGDTYTYDYAVTGRADVERMKTLALAGRGLSTFISKHVRDRYASKA